MNYNGKINPASPEIFAAVFGEGVTPEDVLRDAEEAERTPQDYIMSHCVEAQKNGMETDLYEAKDACCEECNIPTS